MYSLEDRIEELIKDILDYYKVELFGIKIGSYRKKKRLQIFIDEYEGGITLDKCAVISKEISLVLDNSNIIQDSYILEVSSPGIDWPIVSDKELRRVLNRILKVVYKEEDKDGNLKTKTIIGKLKDFNDEYIILKLDKEDKKIFRGSIESIKQEIKF